VRSGLTSDGSRLPRTLTGARARSPVPTERIGLERRHHLRQRLAQRALRLPSEQLAGARDVERIVVVRAIDHPRLDERLLAGEVIQHPGARLRQRRQRGGDLDGLHRLAVDQPRERVLELVVAQRLRLAEQQRELRWQLRASLDDPFDGVDEIVHVQESLAVRRRARVEPTGEVALADALDLLRQRDRVTEIVVDAGDAQQHGRNVAALVTNELLGPDLRCRIRPGRLDRPILVDELAGLGRPVHEHRAREDELLDLKVLRAKLPEQPAGPLDGDLLVLRARLAEEIVVGGEVDHRGHVRPVVGTDGAQPLPHALVGRNVDGDTDAARRRRLGRLAVEADDVRELSGEPPHDSVADPPVGAADDEDPALRLHRLPRPRVALSAVVRDCEC
jgi:hypothetical protein